MTVIPIDYDLATEVRRGHVHARLRTVELTPEVTVSFLRQARNIMLDARVMRLLIEFELAHVLDEERAFDVMSQCFGAMSGARVALVNRDPRQHPSLSFCALVSQEFGEDLGYFVESQAARDWLLAD